MTVLIIAILVSVVDLIVAGVGNGADLRWNRHRVWAEALLGTGIVAFVALSIALRRPKEQFFTMVTQTCATLLWALAVYRTPRAWRALAR